MKTKRITNLFNLTLALLLTLVSGAFTEVSADEVVSAVSRESGVVSTRHDDQLLTVAAFRLVPIADNNGTPRAREDVETKTVVGGSSTAADDPSLKISARYQNSEMLGLLNRTSMQQVVTLFTEASNMIDARHVNPNSYEDRTAAAMEGIARALENPVFLQANRVSPNPQAIAAVQQQLQQMAYAQPARSLSESIGLMQYAAELANRQLGVRREAVALEFLNASIDSLDKYSALMPKAGGNSPGASLEVRRTAGLEENIVGIGVEMKLDPRGALLEGVVEGSPAAGLGLQAGDIIVAVNQKSIAGQSLDMIANQIGGASGTNVTLDIDRNGQMLRGTAQRRRFYVSSVTGTKMVDTTAKLGYIRLKQFSESSQEDLEKAMFTLHNQGMKGLILDLRGNPGGLLDESIDVSNMFLPSGVIVATKGRNADDNTQESASFEKTWAVPLVVLVNEDSASASEILAAAIQDNGRGLVIGRNSYGKGTVQTHFPLRTVSGVLKLTTAKFYSPTGREMAGAGVQPDLPVQVQTTAYRGLESDPDVLAAVQAMLQGTPDQMARASAQGRPINFRQVQQYQPAPQFNNNAQGNFDANYNVNRFEQNPRFEPTPQLSVPGQGRLLRPEPLGLGLAEH